ncbi:hypothetical protein ACRXCV_14395 [Halobacteriovorax sp. GFR7]|uniref:hypothetical protein n=1 Tax=unclassified Halobacteriovorax TaxID=2639665 RepID=UPI003D97219A
MKYLLTILSLCFSIYANTNPSMLNVDWQKKILSDDMKDIIETKLDKILADKQYTVDIEIKVTTPRKPSFKQTPKQAPEEVKFTNVAKTSPGDYIVLSKFGLETPITANMNSKEAPANSEYEYLWKYQESQSIFNNLESIEVSIRLPESLNEDQRQHVEKLVKETKFSLKDFTIDYKFIYINLKPLKLYENKVANDSAVAAETESDSNIWSLLEKFATPIGIFLGALTISLCSLLIFKKYEKLRNDILQRKITLDSNNKNVVDNKNSSDEVDNGIGGGEVLGGSSSDQKDENTISGFERLIKTLDESPQTVILLIKGWIKSEEELAKQSLVYLLDKLDSQSLHTIFEKLNMAERQEWKSVIDSTPYNSIRATAVDSYITNSIINSFIVPDIVESDELKEKLLSIDDEGAFEFFKNNRDLAPLFLTICPTHTMNYILSKIDIEERAKYLKSAAAINTANEDELFVEINERLSKYISIEVVSPFIEKIMAMIPISSHEDEEYLYDVLLQNGLTNKVESIALKNFPSFLLGKLSEKSLNKIFMSYTMIRRVELIESFDDEELRNTFISSFAKEGTTIYEMYELEQERFVIDDSARLALEESKADNYCEVYKKARELVLSDLEITRDAKQVIYEWIKSVREEESLELVS